MGACVCVLIPISSWSAFAIGSLGDYGLGAGDYYRAIPYMFYPFCAIVISLLLACRKFPLLGSMKKAYQRVENGGPLLDEGQPVEEIGDVPEEVKKKASIWNFQMCIRDRRREGSGWYTGSPERARKKSPG